MVVTNEMTTMYHTLSFNPYLKFLQIGVVGSLLRLQVEVQESALKSKYPFGRHSHPTSLSRKKDSLQLSSGAFQRS